MVEIIRYCRHCLGDAPRERPLSDTSPDDGTRDAVNGRLIIAESIQDPTEDDLIMLLGRVINDRDLAVHVFGEKLKYRMDVELIGEAIREETLKRSTPHHPAIDMKWEPYEEHKMPNEE